MKKGFIIFLATFIFLSIDAQEFDISNVFAKAFEIVNEKNGKERFKGQILKGKRNGMGLVSFKDGSVYAGDFYRGNRTGYGLLISSTNIDNCDSCVVYVGNWKDGKKEGNGICYAGSGEILYQGAFVDDKPTGIYPSANRNFQKSFSVMDLGNDDVFIGEMENGNANGLGLIVFNNGDLWQSSFKDNQRKGIGLYLAYNGEWETLNCKGEDYDVVSSSENYRAMDATRKANFRHGISLALKEFTNAAETGMGLVTMKSNNSVSITTDNSNNDIANNSSSVDHMDTPKKSSATTDKKSGKVTNTAANGQAWQTDSRNYSNYESLLIKMNSNWDNQYNDSDRRSYQKKMKDIRTKWEKQGYHITQSEWENWNGKKK